MTDHERLIKETAKAIWIQRNAGDEIGWGEMAWAEITSPDDWSQEALDALEEARAALAVFEEANTPTDDEREALADFLDELHGPWVTEGGCDFRAWNQPWRPGDRRKVNESVDALLGWLRDHGFHRTVQGEPEEPDLPNGHAPVGKLSRFLQRRIANAQSELSSEVPEPSTAPAICSACGVPFHLVQHDEGCDARKMDEKAPEPQGACPQCRRTDGRHKLGCGERFDPEVHDELTRERDHHGIDPEPQGEPSDAAVSAKTWERRWKTLHTKYQERAAECERLRAALDGLNADVEDLLSVAGQSGVEKAKSHAIRTQLASIRRMRAALRAAVAVTEQGENR
ncbi:hypothetical protein J2Y69_003580 [Microbacterium resistens]|uniref:Uncharacterized protein n=1 Tax=Microbacterium resistens TaxID=156977 RepID=A0ABU1SHC2_9MICO|nr:hypothetical protein [Microbacterium resistens]MDR6868954.1 hypothetical protein [Microbacterium resistens]